MPKLVSIGRTRVLIGEAAPNSASEIAAKARSHPEAAHFYIPSLDGIRALAFLIVFFAHAGWSRIPGGFGVMVFFFLSGYPITTLMRREAEWTGQVDLGTFYIRRVLRILPPYYLVLAVATLAMTVVEPREVRWSAIASQVFQVTNYYRIFEADAGIGLGMGVAWSLAVEEHFYLLFPLSYLALRRWFGPRGQAISLLSLCGLILAWRCVLVYGVGASEPRITMGTDTRVDSILFGCIMAVAANPMLDRVGAIRRRVDLAFVPLAIFTLWVSWVVKNDGFHETFRHTLQGLAMIPLFTAAIRHHDWPPFQVLNWRWVRFLGILSYSLYLIHLNVLEVLPKAGLGLPRGINAAVALTISLVLSLAMYRLVELPCARLRKRFSRAA